MAVVDIGSVVAASRRVVALFVARRTPTARTALLVIGTVCPGAKAVTPIAIRTIAIGPVAIGDVTVSKVALGVGLARSEDCLLYTSPSPRDS